MIKEAFTYPLRTSEPIKTLLIGGFFLATGTVLSLVFVLGYLVRVLASGTAAEPAPRFDRWWALAVDGVRALLVWVAYVAVPLLVLVCWIELYVNTPVTSGLFSPLDQHLLNVFVHGLGVGVGGPIAFRPLVQTVYDLATLGGLFAGIVPLFSALHTPAVVQFLGVLYGLTLLVCLYLFPIAFANFAFERTLRSAFAFATIKRAALNAKYTLGWGCAVVILVVGATGPILWNEWRLLAAGADWGLLHIGFIPVVAHPTPTGVQSVLFLALGSFVNFYLLVVGYALLRSVLTPLLAEEVSRSDAPATALDDADS